MEKKRHVIFLDIDGVLQPKGSQLRFDHDLLELQKELAKKYNDEGYLQLNQYDLGAVFYDWHPEPVERLRKLCVDIPAEIVISSDWRFYSPLPRLKFFFRMHDMEKYVTDELPKISGQMRCGELTEYLRLNQDIHRFVILDDAHTHDFNENYPDNFVYCPNIFTEECYQKAVEILTKA